MPKKIKREKWGGAPLGQRWWVAVCTAYNLPEPATEHHFTDTAAGEPNYRFDVAWPEWKVAMEIQGGIWMKGGAHSLPTNHLRDMKKINLAQAKGWLVLQVTPQQVKSGEWVTLVQQVLESRTKHR